MTQNKCIKCGECCKGEIGPFVFPNDIILISTELKMTPFDFLRMYCEKHILSTKLGELEIYTIISNKNGCIFLENNLCKIYKHRPFQCIKSPYEFLGYYEYWEHMKCITKKDFEHINTEINDVKMFKQIINIGYKSFERSD